MNLAEKLGYPKDTILLMVHADDAGLSHSENQATQEALPGGIVNSYSIMVSCPWFLEMAAFAKKNPQYDYGIHLTLTSEWQYYKFGPVLAASEVPSLTDKNGHFFPKSKLVGLNAAPKEVEKEWRAQIERALHFGLQPTHLDSHMYSAGASPALFEVYRKLGKEYGLPVLMSKQLLEMVALDADQVLHKDDFLVDKIHMANFDYFDSRKLHRFYQNIFEELIPGFNLVLIHPAFDTPEMQSITINHPHFGAGWRQVDFDFFTSESTKTQISAHNIQLITWKEIGKTLYEV